MLTDKAMKVKDLMIGNYVNCKWDEEVWSDEKDEWIDIEKEAIGRVVFLDSTGFSEYDIMVEGESNREHFDAIEPIPLTEEWLLKLGGCKAQNNWFRFTAMPSENKEIITIHINTSSFITSCFGDEALEPCFFKECKYVHQLQNLYFALTGEELTLKP